MSLFFVCAISAMLVLAWLMCGVKNRITEDKDLAIASQIIVAVTFVGAFLSLQILAVTIFLVVHLHIT